MNLNLNVLLKIGALACLIIMILATAVAIAYQAHQQRLLVANLQYLQRGEAELEADWSRLLIEQGMYSRHNRIEAQARQVLNMRLPAVAETVVVIQP